MSSMSNKYQRFKEYNANTSICLQSPNGRTSEVTRSPDALSN